MAELRRVGGSMEPHRRPTGRRTLLPAEVQLCEAVGLSEEEYWYFVDAAEQYNGKRDPAYDLIPDIRNDAVVTPILINLAIGLLLTGAALLLAPKPKSPQTTNEQKKQLGRLTLGGAEGANNFAQADGFQSVQELARLGQTIPLVFAKKGVRVNGQLVWSQMIAEARGMQLKAMFVFSDGVTQEPPDFAGLAIGDTTLQSYTAQKVRAYWNAFGGRITENMTLAGSGLPPQQFTDTFSTQWDGLGAPAPFFSGATFTTVQSQFGCYAPMPSQTSFTPQPELILIPDEADDELKEDLATRQRLMNEARFSQRAFFREVRNRDGGGGLGYSGRVAPSPVPGGTYDQIMYRITTGCEVVDDPEFKPEKLNFVNSSTISTRQAADNNIAVGELYLVGSTTLATCAQKIYSVPGKTWTPDPSEIEYAVSGPNEVIAWFSVTTPNGFVQCIPNTGSALSSEQNAVANPVASHEAYALQRAAVATVTNTIPCQATELIIKSNVWKQVGGFPDLQAWPSLKLIREYEEFGGNLSLGTLTKYQRRLSFFMLEARTIGEQEWTDITGPSFFMVDGNTPTDQYNYIRVDIGQKHPNQNRESEFRLRPVSGVGALRTGYNNNAVPMRRLRYGVEKQYTWNGYVITYSGDEVPLTDEFLANSDFIRGGDKVVREGALNNMGLSLTQVGIVGGVIGPEQWTPAPGGYRFDLGGSRNFTAKRISYGRNPTLSNYWEKVWDNSTVTSGTFPTLQQEPPQPSYQTSRIRYFWRNDDPSKENYSQISPDRMYLTVWRSILREDYIKSGMVETEPYVAGVVDAVHIPGETTEGASGLQFFVEVWQDTFKTQDIGYRWYVHSGSKAQGYKKGDRVIVVSPDGSRQPGYQIWGPTITGTVTVDETLLNASNWSQFDPILDVPTFDSQTQSNTSGPEHELVAINEKRAQSAPSYEGMTTAGIRINSSTEWSNFSSFSAFMKKGIVLSNLATGTFEASNLLPDIVYGMMTNEVWGAGKTLGPQQVDVEKMRLASNFCNAMNFTWDGVVADRINFRQWVFEQAQYCLLDATVIGGKFALKPAVPISSNYRIANNQFPDIRALFTDGNMSEMQVTWLSPEERQLFTAEMLWREDTVNGFPKTRQFTIRYNDALGGSATDPVETFDMTAFCTSREHAYQFAQYALGVRKHVDHAIKFQTTPQAAMALEPGDYFQVSSESSHVSRFNNGSINNEGFITSTDSIPDGPLTIYYWRQGTEGIAGPTTIQVLDGRCTDVSFHNTVFTQVMTVTEQRVYKLESLTYADDGLVELSGSHMPLNSGDGSLAILDWNPDYYESFGL